MLHCSRLQNRVAAPDMTRPRAGYEGIAVCAPTTIPDTRYSIRSAHWLCGRALAELVFAAGIAKDDVDGFCVSSFTLAPDSAVGLMQHLGTSPRWLDF